MPTHYEDVFATQFISDLRHWVETDRKTALRVFRLVQDTMRHPDHGLGKPKRLKGPLAGCWSRPITQEHRLLYRVRKNQIHFLQARYHYS